MRNGLKFGGLLVALFFVVASTSSCGRARYKDMSDERRHAQFVGQELLLERLQNSRLDLVTPDGEAVVAGAFLASTEACETVAGRS